MTPSDASVKDQATGLTIGSEKVVLEGVLAPLISFTQHLAIIHSALFGTELIVTSGKDSQHVASSLHYEGRAVDVRTRDKSDEQNMLLLAVLAYCAPANTIGVFDERALADQPHIHLEYRGA